MRPCPTCQCFVPTAASCCPRCEAPLEPIAACEQVEPERERDLVLVGAGQFAATLSGSHHQTHGGDSIARSVVAHVALPPLEGPAGLPRRPSLPKLPQPFAPDPLVLAVFLGIPLRDAVAPTGHDDDDRAETAEPVGTAVPTTLKLPPDAFAALLGTSGTEPVAGRRGDDLLPLARATTPTAAPTPTPTAPQPAVVAVPVVIPAAGPGRLQPLPRRSRFARRDPFARRTTRRERFLTRACLFLAITLALAVLALRLPIGARPDLAASSVGVGDSVASAPDTPTTTPFVDAIRVQTRADLRVVLATTARVYPVWQTYAPATHVVLGRALLQFGFVTATQGSRRVGEMSVAGSAHRIVLAEYAGPGGCAYARVIDQRPAETATVPTGTPCRASSAPTGGWTLLGRDG